MCQTRGSYGSSCPDGDYQCDEVGTNIVCLNNTCGCSNSTTNWFWSGVHCAQCPLSFSIMGYYCYYATTFSNTWSVTKAYCKSYGGTLLVFRNQDDFNIWQTNGVSFMSANSYALIGKFYLLCFFE